MDELQPAGEPQKALLPEGEEEPPPGVRTMSVVRWALVLLMALVAGVSWVSLAAPAPRASASATLYLCPMHPSVLQDRAGSCPICGMDLVKTEPGQRTTGATGAATAAAKAPAAGPGKYWCPMHPEVNSDDPEARCLKCGGMKLLPREAAPSEAHGEPPAGLVPLELSPDRIQLTGLRTAKVVSEPLGDRLRTIGFVTAGETSVAIVNTRFSGWVSAVHVARTGQTVQKGDPLLTVYSPELLTGKQVFLNAAGIPDPEGNRRLALLGLQAQDIAEMTKPGSPPGVVPIRSPISGVVAKRSAIPGLYFTPGVELFQIADLSTVWVLADVYEQDIDRVKVGQTATLRLSSFPRERFAGRIQFLSPAVSADSRTLQAQVAIRNPGLKLRPGMFGDVTIDLQPTAGLVVPAEAVVDAGEAQYLFVARPGGRFEPRRVQVGSRAEGKVQVLEGVAEGEEVVTTGNFLLDSESRLRAAVEGFAPEVRDGHDHDGAAPHEHAGSPSPGGQRKPD